jgi:hypothetical protein
MLVYHFLCLTETNYVFDNAKYTELFPQTIVKEIYFFLGETSRKPLEVPSLLQSSPPNFKNFQFFVVSPLPLGLRLNQRIKG